MSNDSLIYCSECENPTNRDAAFSQCESCVNKAVKRINIGKAAGAFIEYEISQDRAGSVDLAAIERACDSYVQSLNTLSTSVQKEPENEHVCSEISVVDYNIEHLIQKMRKADLRAFPNAAIMPSDFHYRQRAEEIIAMLRSPEIVDIDEKIVRIIERCVSTCVRLVVLEGDAQQHGDKCIQNLLNDLTPYLRTTKPVSGNQHLNVAYIHAKHIYQHTPEDLEQFGGYEVVNDCIGHAREIMTALEAAGVSRVD